MPLLDILTFDDDITGTQAERQHRERELKLTIERERLKRQLKSMDGERLDALQDEQRRAITVREASATSSFHDGHNDVHSCIFFE